MTTWYDVRLEELRQRKLENGTHVDSGPIAEACSTAVSRGETTWAALAKACGMLHSGERGDSTALKRTLGMAAPTRTRPSAHQGVVRHEVAVKLVRALDLWPTDYGI